jgi:MazG family protein
MTDTGKLFEQLLLAVARLRDPKKGCPWDLQQTHSSLKPYMIEEAYEATDAIDTAEKKKNYKKLAEELGDVLFQVVLHSQVASDNKEFVIDDVLRVLTEKIVRRHPHVFAKGKAKTAEEVAQHWETLKKKEQPDTASLLSGLPKAMPALLKCHRIGEKVARVGFDWDESAEVKEKVLEELNEFLEADSKKQRDAAHTREEFGDMLFTLAQLARKMGWNAEDVLAEANDKFCNRFQQMEEMAKGKIHEASSEKLQEYWQRVKEKEVKAKARSKKK